MACCSKELLSRNLGRQQFNTVKAVLLKHMEQLAVEFQNPAVYVQEFLDIKQKPDRGSDISSPGWKGSLYIREGQKIEKWSY